MPSLVLIGPAVRPAIGNIRTDRQINRHNAFYYVDLVIVMKIFFVIVIVSFTF